MNLGDIDLHTVNYNRPRLNHNTSRHSIAASNEETSQSEADYAADTESVTTAETVVRLATPPQSTYESFEHAQSEATVKLNGIPVQEATHAVAMTSNIRPGEGRVRSIETAATNRPMLDEIESAPPTPNHDDTPYIRYAIDQITRDHNARGSQRPTTATSVETYPVERLVHDHGLGYVQSVKRVKGPALVHLGPTTVSKSELFIPVEPQFDSPRYPLLTFIPMRLRPFPMIMIMFLCVLMIVALMFCAIYSMTHNGLDDYVGGLYSAQYFLFQFVPQILAAILLLLVEGIMSAVSRIVPFTMMASDNSHRRSNALFVGLYPGSLLWPRFDYFSSGEISLGIFSVLLWPMPLTIPLQGSLFSVIFVDGWRWTAVRGVVWTLVVIYILALISLMGISAYFFGRSTGLIWDPRSVADIIALLPHSNILGEYEDTEVLLGKRELRARLAVSSERLGYWRTNNALQDIFYCIGEEGAPIRRYTIQDGKAEKLSRFRGSIYEEKSSLDVEALSPHPLLRSATDSSGLELPKNRGIRYRFIPWYLNDAFVLLWPIAAFFFVLAIIVVAFLPSTAFSGGFLPLVPAAPDSAGFSSANFLYSFVLSFIGLLIYYAFRTLSQMLRRLAPWAALSSPYGAIASESILLDYTASFPFLTAFVNKHYLLAFLAILAPLSILLPVLAGGLFFPIQYLPSNTVYMLPNLTAFYIILVLLILCVIALISLAVSFLGKSGRRRYRLPHPVSCLAEIISFVYASSIVHDAAFRSIRSKADLRARLIGRRERGTAGGASPEVRYRFDIFRGRDGRSHIGIERLRREEGWMERVGGKRRRHGSQRTKA